MPALPSPGKVIRTNLSGTISVGGVWLVRHYMSYTGANPTAANLATFDTNVVNIYTSNLAPLADVDTILTQVESIDLSSATGAIDITPTSIAGTRAGTVLPAAACTVVSYEITRRYRGGHSRGYWRFGTANDIATPRQWSTGYPAVVNGDLTAYFNYLVSNAPVAIGTVAHVNVSYYAGFHVVTNPITGRARNVPLVRATPVVDPITAIQTRLSIGSQRRREAFVA